MLTFLSLLSLKYNSLDIILVFICFLSDTFGDLAKKPTSLQTRK